MVVGPLSAFPGLAVPRPLALLRAVAESFRAERERWPLWLPVGFGTGIAVYFALPAEPPLWLAAVLGVGGLASAVLAIRATGLAMRLMLAAAAVLSLGFAHAALRAVRVAAPVLTHRAGPVGIDGLVESVQAHGKGVRVVIAELHAKRLRGATPAKVRVSIRAASDALVPGNWVHLNAILMPPPGPAAPGGYDFGRAAWFDRVGAVGFAYGRAHAIAPLQAPGLAEQWTVAVARLRWHLTERIHAVLPGSTGGIAAALITGDRGLISDDDEAALRDAGLAHVLAIAGLHMALVGLGLFWVVRAILAAIPPLALNQPIKKWAAWAALGGATFYLIISGAATPATRAYIMLATMLIAILLDRPALSMRSVALSSFIVLLLRPESITEPGFQMSFAAVAGLVAVAEWEARRRMAAEHAGPKRFATLRRYLHGIAVTSFVGSIATAPYAIYHFDRATHYAVLGNLLAMPVMGFVTMPAAALAIMAMPFGLEKWPLEAMGVGIEIMLKMGRFVSGLPGAISTVPAWPMSALVLISLGGLWTFLWRRPWRWIGLAPMLAGLVLAVATQGPDLLVSRDAGTVAVRSRDGILHFVRAPSDDYSADQWLKRDGDGRASADAIASPKDGVRCDGYGCIARARDGTLIAAVRRIDALAEDCARAAIVISTVPASRDCRGPKLVIDRFDVTHAGGYAIWLGRAMRVETVEGERGLRPWSARQYRRIKPTSLPWTRTRSAP
ncbi:MAG TPA: ComEC/Rec2 family competence protein [Rhizomicrobium sp.]|nr:ComEC/Rec2 family competence protein [Rhizomicrobium sp.]